MSSDGCLTLKRGASTSPQSLSETNIQDVENGLSPDATHRLIICSRGYWNHLGHRRSLAEICLMNLYIHWYTGTVEFPKSQVVCRKLLGWVHLCLGFATDGDLEFLTRGHIVEPQNVGRESVLIWDILSKAIRDGGTCSIFGDIFFNKGFSAAAADTHQGRPWWSDWTSQARKWMTNGEVWFCTKQKTLLLMVRCTTGALSRQGKYLHRKSTAGPLRLVSRLRFLSVGAWESSISPSTFYLCWWGWRVLSVVIL